MNMEKNTMYKSNFHTKKECLTFKQFEKNQI